MIVLKVFGTSASIFFLGALIAIVCKPYPTHRAESALKTTSGIMMVAGALGALVSLLLATWTGL